MGATTWPPYSSSEGGYAPLGLPRQRSERPGAAVAPLDPTSGSGDRGQPRGGADLGELTGVIVPMVVV